jgi:CDP-glucose 4,6-dehydratase
VGGALVDMLLLVGAEVYVIGRGVDFQRSLYGPGVAPMGQPIAHGVERVIFCDMTDMLQLGHAVKVASPDIVFHLAATTQVTEAADWPVHTFEVNTMGTLKLLEAIRLTKPDTKVVISSSDKVYGHPPERYMPCNEDTPYTVTHPYDASKAAAELVAQTYGYQHEMNIHVARMSNVYGPGDTNWKRLIPGMIRWTFNQETPIIRSDGEQVRQYMYIADAIHGLARIAMIMGDQREVDNFEYWNLSPAPEEAISVMQLVFMIAETIGANWNIWMREPKILNQASDECPRLVIESDHADDWLDWKAKTRLRHGLFLTAEWFVQLANREYLLK